MADVAKAANSGALSNRLLHLERPLKDGVAVLVVLVGETEHLLESSPQSLNELPNGAALGVFPHVLQDLLYRSLFPGLISGVASIHLCLDVILGDLLQDASPLLLHLCITEYDVDHLLHHRLDSAHVGVDERCVHHDLAGRDVDVGTHVLAALTVRQNVIRIIDDRDVLGNRSECAGDGGLHLALLNRDGYNPARHSEQFAKAVLVLCVQRLNSRIG